MQRLRDSRQEGKTGLGPTALAWNIPRPADNQTERGGTLTAHHGHHRDHAEARKGQIEKRQAGSLQKKWQVT